MNKEVKDTYSITPDMIEMGLGGNTLVLYAFLRENGEVTLSLPKMSEYVGITVNTLRRILQELVDMNLVVRFEGGVNVPATYAVRNTTKTSPAVLVTTTPTLEERVVEEEPPLRRERSGGKISPARELFKRRNGRELE